MATTEGTSGHYRQTWKLPLKLLSGV